MASAAAPAPAPDGVVFRADGVDLVRDGLLLLDRVSVTIRAGEHWALLGPNGAGKSTLLQIMATYAYPTRGQVDVLGHQLGRVNVFALRPLIGHVSPHHRVDPLRTVREVRAHRRHRHDSARAAQADQRGRTGARGRADRAAGPG